MGGGALDKGQIGADLRLKPAVLEHRRESHPPPLPRERHELKELASLPIPDELLAEIFLRLPTPVDLVSASGACVSFRCVATGRSFVQRFRKLHAPPLLGFLDHQGKGFHPAAPPHPSAPAASAVALAADFSFSFLPARYCVVQDIRDGRVLLDCISVNAVRKFFTQFVVCDPLHRRYLLLPPIPDEIVQCPRHTFLVPYAGSGDKEEAAEETAFRVIWMTRRGETLVALVFSSSTGQWQAGPSHSWSNSFAGLLRVPGLVSSTLPQFAYGSFYWVSDIREKLLVLDTRKMEFSIADAPPEAKGSRDVDIPI